MADTTRGRYYDDLEDVSFSPEAMLAGAILIDAKTAVKVAKAKGIQEGDFTRPLTAAVWKAASKLYDAGDGADITIVDIYRDVLKQERYSALSMKEFTAFTERCFFYKPSAKEEACASYCAAVKNRRSETILGNIGFQLQNLATGYENPGDVARRAIEILQSVVEQSEEPEKQTVSSGEAITEWSSYYHAVSQNRDLALCKTGYKALDALLGGFYNGKVYIVAARPGMGKTTFAVNVAERIAKERRVLFVSIEMTTRDITAKRLARESGVSFRGLITGDLAEEDFHRAVKAAGDLYNAKLELVDGVYSLEEIEAVARSIPDLGLVVIDYFGLLERDRKLASYDAATQVSASLARMAKAINLPILCLCQLNRENTKRASKRPTMADLRDSGAIEQDAAAVLLLHRDGYYEDGEERPQFEDLQVIVDKNRYGRTGTAVLTWDGGTGRIDDHKGAWT